MQFKEAKQNHQEEPIFEEIKPSQTSPLVETFTQEALFLKPFC
jgi:hypothetical protein